MISKAQEEDWDLTPVINLIYSLSPCENRTLDLESPEGSLRTPPESPDIPTITEPKSEQATHLGNFDKIWQYLGQPVNQLPPSSPSVSEIGAAETLDLSGHGFVSSSKAVKWRDELEGADLADNDENFDPHSLSSLTKAQRKKARRRQRREKHTEAPTEGRPLTSDSEDDSGKDVKAPQTPDRRAIIHEMLHGNSASESDCGRVLSANHHIKETTTVSRSWPVASPHHAKSTVKTLEHQRDSAFAVAVAKKVKLLTLLNETFIDERPYLSNISFVQPVSSSSGALAEGIHIFVDVSNIMIGFHDALKLSRGITRAQRIRRQPLSFHNLSLILERGRPTAKRILVGSDNFPAITEARAIGYETNILDRVHKAKELTPRQKRFMSYGNGTGTGSGSETTAATAAVQYAPEKWVEQAVDEILHLKMMESIVDVSEPSTMVLATGDAAEAEYSGGFMKMVERALGKGWKVELACFKHNMSSAYKRGEFRQKWGERFTIVELDAFVDVLLGSE